MIKLCLTFYFLSAYAFMSTKALKILIFAGDILANKVYESVYIA